MGKRKYPFRLYGRHDLELISLMSTRKFNITKAVYCSLTAFCNGDIFRIKLPPEKEYADYEIRKSYLKILILDEEKDKKAITVMEKIAKGYRSSFLKNILRLYLCAPISADYLENPEDYELFENMLSVFSRDRRMADAASFGKNIKKRVEKKATREVIYKKSDPTQTGVIECKSTKEEPEPVQNQVYAEKKEDSNHYSPDISNIFSRPEVNSTENSGRTDDLQSKINSEEVEENHTKNMEIDEDEQAEMTDLFANLLGL